MIKFFYSLKRFEFLKKEAEKTAKAVLKEMKRKGRVEIYFVKDEEMAEINKVSRGKKGPTNILSFETKEYFPRPDLKEPFLGEIYIAPDYSKKKGDSVKLLIIHGVLHLLGFDHKTKKEASIMEKKEEFFLKRV
ncbi:MAG: rRNA maturation RNase YbeY [Candidatus Pacebacteria bacterium]|nr:rRNA maturation RNase YbeY [Candidatus Paceibacterota bacterium]